MRAVVGFTRFSTMCRQKPTTLAIERREVVDRRDAIPDPSACRRRVGFSGRRDGQAGLVERERSRELLAAICGLNAAFGAIGDRLLRLVDASTAPEARRTRRTRPARRRAAPVRRPMRCVGEAGDEFERVPGGSREPAGRADSGPARPVRRSTPCSNVVSVQVLTSEGATVGGLVCRY